jgi:hypothetical protein
MPDDAGSAVVDDGIGTPTPPPSRQQHIMERIMWEVSRANWLILAHTNYG